MATELERARAEAEKALALCNSETADGIIGSPPPEEYGILVQGVKAIYQMLWMMAKANGLKQNKATLQMGAQAMLMLATIVHYAYALGIRRGSESANQQINDGDTPAHRRQRTRSRARQVAVYHEVPGTGAGSNGGG